jgi:hypothetical protein
MRQKTLETILVLVIALGVVCWFTGNRYYLLAAGLLGFTGLAIPALAEKIHWLWMKLGEGMGYVSSRIILSLVFFLVLVPIAFLARLFGRKAVKLDAKGTTCFKERNFRYTKESMEHMW